MTAQHTGTERASSKPIEQCSAYLKKLHEYIAHRFLRPEVRARAYRYLSGLLGEVRRKNSWQMGEARPRGVQHLLNDAQWDADAVRDDLRGYVVEHLGDAKSGVLVVDETGFLKKGEKSCGVARQYTGTAGKRENCQVGVFVCYASAKGAAFLDRALYLPREWTVDPQRLCEAGVPERVGSRWSIGWAGSRRSRRRQGRPSRFGGQYVHPAADVSSGEYGLNSLSFDLRVTQRWIGGTDVPVFGSVGRKQSRGDQGA
jgi:hypothetical protein